jgi:hypothetical protein
MVKRILVIFFLLELLYIFGILLNYDNSWIHNEKLETHRWFLENGRSLKLEDLKRGLNVAVIEGSYTGSAAYNRITRPLSNMFELLNAKFRVWLWNFVPPHPSLSLSWPLSFILVPLLLFLFFKNMGCSGEISFSGAMMYLATIGFLGPIIMLMHPGKSFINICAVLSLFFASRIHRRMIERSPGCFLIEEGAMRGIICSCIAQSLSPFFGTKPGYLFTRWYFSYLPLRFS